MSDLQTLACLAAMRKTKLNYIIKSNQHHNTYLHDVFAAHSLISLSTKK